MAFSRGNRSQGTVEAGFVRGNRRCWRGVVGEARGARPRHLSGRAHRARVTTLVLVSRADEASTNIRDALLDMEAWDEVGSFEGLPVRARGEFLMAEISGAHVEADGVDGRLRQAGIAFDTMLVASKHRAASGKPALTVHPIGNFHDAQVGGKPGMLVPTAPLHMARILRRLHAESKGLKHEATFEATHHGPYLETPTAFVEIGTDESAWTDPDLARRVARAILASVEASPLDEAPTLVALGGSHYAPRASDLARKGRANFGHIIPGYALDGGLPERLVYDAIRFTPGCRGYHVDPRGTSRPLDDVTAVFGAMELGWWTDEEL